MYSANFLPHPILLRFNGLRLPSISANALFAPPSGCLLLASLFMHKVKRLLQVSESVPLDRLGFRVVCHRFISESSRPLGMVLRPQSSFKQASGTFLLPIPSSPSSSHIFFFC